MVRCLTTFTSLRENLPLLVTKLPISADAQCLKSIFPILFLSVLTSALEVNDVVPNEECGRWNIARLLLG